MGQLLRVAQFKMMIVQNRHEQQVLQCKRSWFLPKQETRLWYLAPFRWQIRLLENEKSAIIAKLVAKLLLVKSVAEAGESSAAAALTNAISLRFCTSFSLATKLRRKEKRRATEHFCLDSVLNSPINFWLICS